MKAGAGSFSRKCTQQSTFFILVGALLSMRLRGVDSEVKWSVEKVADPQVSVSSAGVWSLKPMSGTAKVSFYSVGFIHGYTFAGAEGDSVYVEGVEWRRMRRRSASPSKNERREPIYSEYDIRVPEQEARTGAL